jgi:hypothetical protein
LEPSTSTPCPREVLERYPRAMLHLSADELADLYAIDAVHEFTFLAPGRPERYEGCEEVPMSVRGWPRKASHRLGVARIFTHSIYLSSKVHSRFSLLR